MCETAGAFRTPHLRQTNSDELVLSALALGELRYRLSDDQRLEVLALLVLGECGLILEDFIEEELRRLGERLVDLEGLYARLALGLRQEFPDDADQRVDLLRPGFPKSRADQPIPSSLL